MMSMRKPVKKTIPRFLDSLKGALGPNPFRLCKDLGDGAFTLSLTARAR